MAKGGSLLHLRLLQGGATQEQQARSAERARTGSHIREVVQSAAQELTDVPVRRLEHGAQGWLSPDPALMGLINMSGAREGTLKALLQSVRPRWLMDLRVVPLFDYGQMTRKRFFELFRHLEITYRDVSGLLEMYSRKDASLSSGAAVDLINELLAESPSHSAQGPILFLLEGAERVALAERVLPLLVKPRPERGWIVATWEAQ